MKKTNNPCPECGSKRKDLKMESKYDTRVEWVKCKKCGHEEWDHKIGGLTNCRCPNCASNEINIKSVSAQSGNTDWLIFSCGKCGFDSGLIDDQKYESEYEWYDPSKYTWITKISQDLEEEYRRKPKPGMGTF